MRVSSLSVFEQSSALTSDCPGMGYSCCLGDFKTKIRYSNGVVQTHYYAIKTRECYMRIRKSPFQIGSLLVLSLCVVSCSIVTCWMVKAKIINLKRNLLFKIFVWLAFYLILRWLKYRNTFTTFTKASV